MKNLRPSICLQDCNRVLINYSLQMLDKDYNLQVLFCKLMNPGR